MNYLLYLPRTTPGRNPGTAVVPPRPASAGRSGRVKVTVAKLIAAGKDSFIVVCSVSEPQWWQPHELTALLDEIVEKYAVIRIASM